MNSMNWSKYNNELISRGQVTFWFEDKIASDWYSDQNLGGLLTVDPKPTQTNFV